MLLTPTADMALAGIRANMRAMARMEAVGARVHRAIAVVLAMIGAGTLGGCLGDPPADPATAPVEVVLEGCVLNRSAVASGTHDVAVINSAGYRPGELVVSAQDGTQVLTVAVGDSGQLVTTDQKYTFTCRVGSDHRTSTLESKPQ